jgi:hypothetical protein
MTARRSIRPQRRRFAQLSKQVRCCGWTSVVPTPLIRADVDTGSGAVGCRPGLVGGVQAKPVSAMRSWRGEIGSQRSGCRRTDAQQSVVRPSVGVTQDGVSSYSFCGRSNSTLIVSVSRYFWVLA